MQTKHRQAKTNLSHHSILDEGLGAIALGVCAGLDRAKAAWSRFSLIFIGLYPIAQILVFWKSIFGMRVKKMGERGLRVRVKGSSGGLKEW